MNRTDADTAIEVNKGIAIAALEGKRRGAECMANRKVPFDVAHRVLMFPDRRRHYDWQ